MSIEQTLGELEDLKKELNENEISKKDLLEKAKILLGVMEREKKRIEKEMKDREVCFAKRQRELREEVEFIKDKKKKLERKMMTEEEIQAEKQRTSFGHSCDGQHG